MIDAERFWRRVDKTGECWIWTGEKNNHGYGRYSVGSQQAKTRKRYLTHRLAWRLSGLQLEDSQHLLHSCDNPPCCNPDHLRIGTQQDNMDDMNRRGHGNQGERNGMAKHSAVDVERVRDLHRQGFSYDEIANWLAVPWRFVRDVVTKRRWAKS